MTPNTIEFSTTHNELHNTWVMRITADRRIEVNEDVEVTDAAKKVLEAMQHFLPQRTWVDLTREEFAEILCDDRWQGRPELMMLQVQAKLKDKNTRGQE